MNPVPVQAKPILKWAGGKRQLEEPILKHILKTYPKGFDDYYEPFCGGAAIFFALRSRGLIHGRAHLSDMNLELVSMYQAIRDDVTGVLKELRKLCPPAGFDETRYYDVRSSEPRAQAARAARTIYLNKNGFNGLYRVNQEGGFNVPWGHRKTSYVPAEDDIRAASRALQGVEILHQDFSVYAARRHQFSSAFFYFDPPYVPVTKSADFTAYVKAGFKYADQARLAREVKALNNLGVPFLLSNSDTKTSRALYKGLTIKKVQATRRINSDAAGRGVISELLVSNKKGTSPHG